MPLSARLGYFLRLDMQPVEGTYLAWWLVVVWLVVESELAAPATTATAAPIAIRALVLRPATVPAAAPVAPAVEAAAAGAGAGAGVD